MLFIQGTQDPFAEWGLLEPVIERLGDRATLRPVQGGDHSFKVKGQSEDQAAIGRRLGEEAAEFILERSSARPE